VQTRVEKERMNRKETGESLVLGEVFSPLKAYLPPYVAFSLSSLFSVSLHTSISATVPVRPTQKAWVPASASTIEAQHLQYKEATRVFSLQIERPLISEVLALTGGHRKRAAAELGFSYKALLYKLKQIESEKPSASIKNGAAP
jgi:DNA-binding NtrC family response regulator